MDLNLKVAALEKLLDYCASGIGAVAGSMLGPWRARQAAKVKLIAANAEADSLRVIADAQADARRALVAPDDPAQGAVEISQIGINQRIEFQERKRQANIVSVVQEAAQTLDQSEVPDHEPNPDWTARFFDCVQDVSSDDMKSLWARVLSGEVENPGRTSLRSLDILRNMTMKDADMFRSVCEYIMLDFAYWPREFHQGHAELSYRNVLHLQSIGLCYGSGHAITLEDLKPDSPRLIPFHDFILKISAEGKHKEIEVPAILLTVPGQELFGIVGQGPSAPMDYLRAFSEYLRKNDFELSYAPIIEVLADGRYRYRNESFVKVEGEVREGGHESGADQA